MIFWLLSQIWVSQDAIVTLFDAHLAIGLHVGVVARRPQPAVERRLRHPHEVERRREDLYGTIWKITEKP